jgi:glycosyltransferase involved in cell wall biosynthesis
MRIAYLHQYFVTPEGSGGTRSYEFASRWVRRGHEVTVVTSTAGFPELRAGGRSVLRVDGIEVRVLGVHYTQDLSHRQRIARFAQFAAASCRELARLPRPDVILATSTPLTIALPGVFGARLHRCPMVFEVRDLWPDVPIAVGALRSPVARRAARWLERTAYRESTRVIALSPGMRDGVVRGGVPPWRVSVIPNVADVPRFGGAAADPGLRRRFGPGPIVLYAGTIGFVNGLEYLVALARETGRIAPAVRFLVVGDGKEQARVEAAAREAGVLGANLHFLPPVGKRELPRLLAAADVATSFVRDLPALWDNSANKFFDALAAGRPFLLNYGGWQADLVREHGAGLVVPPGDPAAAARLLVDFLADPARLRRTGEAAAALGRRAFDVDELSDRALAVLEEAVAERRAPARRRRRASRPALAGGAGDG